MHSIFTIVKKELKRSFTDVRVLLGMLLPGLIIFFMYTFQMLNKNKQVIRTLLLE